MAAPSPWSRIRATLAGLIGLLAAARPLTAQPGAPAAPPTIDSITVVGGVRNTPQQIIGVSGLQRNQPATYRSVQRAIQNLFASGQFDDIRVDQRLVGGTFILTIVVKERPLLQKWTVKGVDAVDEGTVRRRISVPEGKPLDRNAVQHSIHAVDSLYHRRGYYAAKVEVTELPQPGEPGAPDLRRDPGPRVVVSQIAVRGQRRPERPGYRERHGHQARGVLVVPERGIPRGRAWRMISGAPSLPGTPIGDISIFEFCATP